jgi:hypothetical protein
MAAREHEHMTWLTRIRAAGRETLDHVASWCRRAGASSSLRPHVRQPWHAGPDWSKRGERRAAPQARRQGVDAPALQGGYRGSTPPPCRAATVI